MLKNLFFRVILFLLLLFPVFFVILISNQEIDKFQPQESIIRSQQAFGYGEKIRVGQIDESFSLKGIIDTLSYASIFIPSDSTNYYLFEKGDELFVDKALYLVNGKTVKSKVSGVIHDVVSKPDGIEVIVKTSEELILIATIDSKTALELNKTYQTVEGKELTLLSVKDTFTENGQEVVFKVKNDDYHLNQNVDTYLLTGKTQQSVLVAPKDCSYIGPNNRETIRIISEDGKVISEKEITISFSSQYDVAINGVNEGDLCDIEYGRFQSSHE